MPTLSSASDLQIRQAENAFLLSQSAEFLLLLACCRAELRGSDDNACERLERAARQVGNWQRALELGEHHGVLPAVHQALCSSRPGRGMPGWVFSKDVLPPEVREEMDRRAAHQAKKNLRLAAELIHILGCLAAAGVEAIPHKGPVLAELVYGDLALRDFSDLDVLVRGGDIPRAKQALAKIGYKPNVELSEAEERAYIGSGYEYTFDGPAGKNLLELQWNFVPRFFAATFAMEAVFARSVAGSVAGRPVRMPAPEDLFLSMCVHAAKHLWGRLCWLRDLAHVVERIEIDWSRVQSEAKRLGVERIVGVSLTLAQILVGAEVSAARSALAGNSQRELGIAAKIAQHIPSAEDYSAESLDYVRWMLRLRENARDRWRYVSRLLLTPSLGEWAWVKLPEPLFPLYRGVRLMRVSGRLLGMRH